MIERRQLPIPNVCRVPNPQSDLDFLGVGSWRLVIGSLGVDKRSLETENKTDAQCPRHRRVDVDIVHAADRLARQA